MPNEPFLVDFLIGGAQKGGTTALAHFLGQHPEIRLPSRKEPHFFDAPDFPDTAAAEELRRRYREHFPAVSGADDEDGDATQRRVIGEATPIYLYLPEVAARVQRYNPAMKWILLLREPIARAVSQYRMEIGRRLEWLPLPWALRLEPLRLWRARRNRAWDSAIRTHSYVERGFYSAQIERLRQHFPAEQILVLTTDELRRQHTATLQRIYDFLGLQNRDFIPVPEVVFSGGDHPPLAPETEAWLQARFAEEIPRLEKLLGRPLDEWRAQ